MKGKGKDTRTAGGRNSIRDAAATRFVTGQIQTIRGNMRTASAVLTNRNSDPMYIVMVDGKPHEVSADLVRLAQEAVKLAAKLTLDGWPKLSETTRRSMKRRHQPMLRVVDEVLPAVSNDDAVEWEGLADKLKV